MGIFDQMRLEMATFPVSDVRFGEQTRLVDGVLEIDKEAIIREVFREEARIDTVDLEIAKPGESVRIWPVRDVVEPRIKVEGPGVVYPGIVGRDVETVGQGRTHRLGGVGVVEVSNVQWHNQGNDPIDQFIDMSGPWAEMVPASKHFNVCAIVEPDDHLDIHEQNYAVHNATLIVAEILARATVELEPPEVKIYETPPTDNDLPKVVYIQCTHSPQAKAHSPKAFCVSTYGFSELMSPWPLHPNEVMDGAISGPYRTLFATSWMTANNPIVEELYRRHNTTMDFRAVISFKTEWTTQREKELAANQAAKMAKMLGADGAIVTWDAGGNEFMEVVYTVRAMEQLGIKTIFMTSEGDPTGGASTLLLPIPEADAIISAGYIETMLIDELKEELPAVERVIGNPVRGAGRSPLGTIIETPDARTKDSSPAPSKFNDHYGFTKVSVFAY